jgi:hypothetical protein
MRKAVANVARTPDQNRKSATGTMGQRRLMLRSSTRTSVTSAAAVAKAGAMAKAARDLYGNEAMGI